MPSNDRRLRVWRDYFNDIGLQDDVREEHLCFISELYRHNLPVIFEIEHLSLLLGLRLNSVLSMIYSPSHFYRTFYIPKKRGGRREISTPLPSLLESQRWINRNIINNLEVSEQTHSFVRGRSIATNAKSHLNAKRMLKVDITDFFGSIGIGRVISIFRDVGYSENVALVLALLCTKDKKLPQGAATSPQLSNLSCKRLDKRLTAAAAFRGLTYTRYADDLTFSGSDLNHGFLKLVSEILRDECFCVNQSKVRFLGPSDRKIITGLVIADGNLRPTSQFRRRVWQEIHFAHKFGLMSHLSKRKIATPLYLDILRGKLSFWRSIDPDDSRLKKAEDRFCRILGK